MIAGRYENLAISFVGALEVLRTMIPYLLLKSSANRSRSRRRLLDHIAAQQLSRPRRPRRYPRKVKPKMSNFNLKRLKDTGSPYNFKEALQLLDVAYSVALLLATSSPAGWRRIAGVNASCEPSPKPGLVVAGRSRFDFSFREGQSGSPSPLPCAPGIALVRLEALVDFSDSAPVSFWVAPFGTPALGEQKPPRWAVMPLRGSAMERGPEMANGSHGLDCLVGPCHLSLVATSLADSLEPPKSLVWSRFRVSVRRRLAGLARGSPPAAEFVADYPAEALGLGTHEPFFADWWACG